jgi:hypothetical protein
MPALFLNLSPMEIKKPFDSTKKNPSVRGFGDFQHIESTGKVHLSQTPVKAFFQLRLDEKEPKIKGLLLSEWVSNIEGRLSVQHKSCFFWVAHRSAAQHAGEQRGFITIFSFPNALSLRTCRPAFFLFDPFQVHALSRLSRQSHPAQG